MLSHTLCIFNLELLTSFSRWRHEYCTPFCTDWFRHYLEFWLQTASLLV